MASEISCHEGLHATPPELDYELVLEISFR